MKATRLLAIVLALQVLTLLGQWFGPQWTSPASAQVPDAGAQRLQMIEELRAMNGRLDKLMDVLQDGKLQVRVVSPDIKDR
ncbi:MAG: hypothetical protein ACREJC_11435 [Tepidisphaeraceae bacterium]